MNEIRLNCFSFTMDQQNNQQILFRKNPKNKKFEKFPNCARSSQAAIYYYFERKNILAQKIKKIFRKNVFNIIIIY